MSFAHFFLEARIAGVDITMLGVSIGPEFYDLPALRAMLRVVFGWIFELLEIVLIGPKPYVMFCFESITALLAVLPVSGMSFIVVV
jgi:hypothetical protein